MNMNNDELYQLTVAVLVKLVPVLKADELSLLCWHCGIQPRELMPVEDKRRPGELRKAA